MKGQISLELIVAVLVMVSVLTLLISYQNGQTRNLVKVTQNVKEKMQADVIGTYCNLFYFNNENLEIKFGPEINQETKHRVECFGAVDWDYKKFR